MLPDLTSYMPHGVCVRWNWNLLSVQIAGDLLVTLAYFTIPFLLLIAIRRGQVVLDRESRVLLGLAGLFILFCGGGHLLDVVLIWHPWYWLRAVWGLAGTGVASWVCIVYIGPKLLEFSRLMQGSVRLSVLQIKLADIEHRLEGLAALGYDPPRPTITTPPEPLPADSSPMV